MPPTNEQTAFTHAVYRATQEIPYGKVTTYGHIARLIGTPQRPRQVGTCLKHLPSASPHHTTTTTTTPTPTQPFTSTTVPWHRVINAKGTISPRTPHPLSAQNQATHLHHENIRTTTGSLGEICVDLSVYGWFPRQLPSEEAEGLDPPDLEEEEGEGGG